MIVGSEPLFCAPLTLGAAVQAAAQALSPSSASPATDAEVLVRHAGNATATDLIAHPQRRLSESARGALAAMVARRQRGEPIAYIVGRREFWSLDFAVSPATLIPRPETELLVERALARIPSGAAWSVADLGTGCGAVALAIAHERPGLCVIATDRSQEALDIANTNAGRLGISNVEFRRGDWLAPLGGRRLDVIVSNPPYVRTDDPHLREGDVRFEPVDALVGGDDGLAALRQISAAAPVHLSAGGWLLVEHGFDKGAGVRALFSERGYREVRTYRDLAGQERVTEGRVA